jgi:hypothetical protein
MPSTNDLLFMAFTLSFVHLWMTYSVLNLVLNLYCYISKILLLSMCSKVLFASLFLKIFENEVKMDRDL